MAENVYALIELINSTHYQAFKSLTPKKKAMTIYKDFEDYYRFQNKASTATDEEKKDRYFFEVERTFVKAQKEIRMLSEEELSTYISYAIYRVDKAIDNANGKKYIENKLLFGTILGQMPKDLNDDNKRKLDILRDNMFVYDERMHEQMHERV